MTTFFTDILKFKEKIEKFTFLLVEAFERMKECGEKENKQKCGWQIQ
jgi:hypothetical protein